MEALSSGSPSQASFTSEAKNHCKREVRGVLVHQMLHHFEVQGLMPSPVVATGGQVAQVLTTPFFAVQFQDVVLESSGTLPESR